MLNPHDIFTQIGLAVDPLDQYTFNDDNNVIYLEIELGQDQNYILQINDNDDPHQIAEKFCLQHNLNRLAIEIVQRKIFEAKYRQKSKEKQKKKIQGHKTSKSSIEDHLNKKNKKKGNTKDNNNDNSKKSIQKQNLSPGMLYKSKENNNKSSNHKPSNNNKTSCNQLDNLARNINQNMYLRSLVAQKKIQQERNKKLKEKEQAEIAGLIFKPQINLVSEKIVQFRRQTGTTITKKKSPQKRIYEELKDCTFKPSINKVSEIIVKNRLNRKQQQNHFQNLYKNTNNHRSKTIEQQNSQELFHPKINEKSASQITQPFMKRVQRAIAKKNKYKQSFADLECSFKPKICRPPKKDRNAQNLPIGDYLNKCSTKRQINTNNNQESKITKKNLSHQHYQNLLESRICDIFDILDGDLDGQISPNNINIQQLSKNSLIFLKPLLLEMDQKSAKFNYQDFRKAVLNLVSETDIGVRGAFLTQKKIRNINSESTFTPQINQRSKEIAQSRNPQTIHKDLYQQGIKQVQNKQLKIQLARAKKEQKLLENCSFKPCLSRSSKYYIQKVLGKKKQSQKHNNFEYDQNQ